MGNDTEKIKKSLMKLAEGYDYQEKEVIMDKNGKSTGKAKVVQKHMPPSMEAIKMIERKMENGNW